MAVSGPSSMTNLEKFYFTAALGKDKYNLGLIHYYHSHFSYFKRNLNETTFMGPGHITPVCPVVLLMSSAK